MSDERPRSCRTSPGKPKVGYPTRDEAMAAIGNQQRMEAYPCWYCHQWHIGHQRGTPLQYRVKGGARVEALLAQLRRSNRD